MIKVEKLTTHMGVKEFVDRGFLQEANRLFFHPLGMSLAVLRDDTGPKFVCMAHDCRDDPEGIIFEDGIIDKKKIENIENLRLSKDVARCKVKNIDSNGWQIEKEKP